MEANVVSLQYLYAPAAVGELLVEGIFRIGKKSMLAAHAHILMWLMLLPLMVGFLVALNLISDALKFIL